MHDATPDTPARRERMKPYPVALLAWSHQDAKEYQAEHPAKFPVAPIVVTPWTRGAIRGRNVSSIVITPQLAEDQDKVAALAPEVWPATLHDGYVGPIIKA